MTSPWEFAGRVFATDDGLSQPARISVESYGVRAIESGGREHTLPFESMHLEKSGEGGRVVVCRSTTSTLAVSCEAPEFLTALRHAGPGSVGTMIDAAIAARTRRERYGHVWVWSTLGTLVGLLAGVLWILPRMFASAVDRIPIDVDKSIGSAAEQSMSLGETVHVPAADGALGEIIARLRVHARPQGYDYRFRVVRQAQVNAFALPGGPIVVFEGLLRRATRADQVAGVLGHEMSHVTLRHGMRGVVRSAGLRMGVAILFGDTGAIGQLATGASVDAVLNGYSRDQEREADAEGVRMAAAAGFDPMGMAEFFDILRREPGTQVPGLLRWFSTHPDSGERIANVRSLAVRAYRGPAAPLGVAWESVRAAVGPTAP